MKISDLFLVTLKDIYFAERQLLKALPKMAKAARSDALRTAFTDHGEQTQGQVERLQRVFEILGKRPAGQTCEAILGLVQECEELLAEAPTPSAVRDAGLIACGQAVEHYEMARYVSLIAWAKLQKQDEIASLLRANLAEEVAADDLLTEVGETSVHADARADA
jgi:ferritin-like metal-binding protein YciE